MKKILVLVIFFVLILTGYSTALENTKSTNKDISMMYYPGASRFGVYDDEKGNITISTDDSALYSDLEKRAVINLMVKKYDWEMMHPDKKIITMSFVKEKNPHGHNIVSVKMVITYKKT